MARTPVIPVLQNPYQGAAGPAVSARAARAVTVGAFAIGAALAGGVVMSQAAYADEPGGTTCEVDQDGDVVNSADGTACATGEETDAAETAPKETVAAEEDAAGDADADKADADETAPKKSDAKKSDAKKAAPKKTAPKETVAAEEDAGAAEEAAAQEAVPETGAPEGTTGTVVASTSAEPAAEPVGAAVPAGGEGALFADASTGAVYDSAGTKVPGLAFDAASGTISDSTGAGGSVVASTSAEPATESAVESAGGAGASGGQGTLFADASTGAVYDSAGTKVPGLAFDPASGTISDSTGAGGSVVASTSAEPAAESAVESAGGAVASGGQGTLFADASTGAVYGPDGTKVRGLTFDPATGTISDSNGNGNRTGAVSPALLPDAAATTTSAPTNAAVLQALAGLTPDQLQQLVAAGELPPDVLADHIPGAPKAPAQSGRGPDRGFAEPDRIALQNLLTIAGAALDGSTDGSEGNVGDLLRRAGINVGLDYAGRTVTELTGTEDWARGATPGLNALLAGATSEQGIDWQQIQAAAVSGLTAEGIRQLGPDLESGVLNGVAPAGGAAIGELLSPDGLTGKEIGSIGEDLAVKTVENVIKDNAPGAAGAMAAGGVGSILGMFADPEHANPVNFLSAMANGIFPGAGLAFMPLAHWFAKEQQRREFEKQMEELNAKADSMAMSNVSQYRDPDTMKPLSLADGTTFQWGNGQPVLDPNTGQLRPYGTAFYQDGMNTINQMTDVAQAIPYAARQAQEARVAEIQANLAAGLNGDGSARTPQQQKQADQLAQWAAEGRADQVAKWNQNTGGLYGAPDPASIPIEIGKASGWRANAFAVEDNEQARLRDPLHGAIGLVGREADARADAAEAQEELHKLYIQQRRAMAGPQYSGGRTGQIIEPPPMPAADRMNQLRADAIRNVAALRLAQSPLADDALLAFEPPSFPCDSDTWDEEQCGPRLTTMGNPRGMQMNQYKPVEEVGTSDIEHEVAAPSAETQQIAAEITASRARANAPQATADYQRVVEGPCGEDGHAGQVNCYGAWNDLLHPRGGKIPYTRDIAQVMAQGHAVYKARKNLLGHDVVQDQRAYIMGAPLLPQVPETPVTP